MSDQIENVRVVFDSDTAGLAGAVNVYEDIERADASAAEQAKKSAAAMDKQSKDMSTLLTGNKKSIDDLSKSFQNLDKTITAGTYKKVLGDIRKELQLTDQQARTFYQNLIANSQKAIIDPASEKDLQELTALIEAASVELKLMGEAEDQVGEKSISLKAQLRAMKAELAAIDDPNSPRFIQLATQAAQLEDRIGDVNQQVKLLASDSSHIDALIQTVQGLAGAYSIAQGAAALLGSEDKDLQKALLQVNAAMSILQGLQQVQQLLDKNSALNIYLIKTLRLQDAAATTAEGTAAVGATAAQRALNAAMAANPAAILLLSITALVGAYIAFKGSAEDAAAAQDEYNQKTEDAIKLNLKFKDAIKSGGDLHIAELKAQGASEKQIRDAELFNLKQQLDDTKKFLDVKTAAYQSADDQLREIAKNGGYVTETINGFTNAKKVSAEYITALQKTKSDYEDLRTNLNDIQQQYDIKALDNQTAANKELEDQQKTADEKRKQLDEKALEQAQKRRDQLIADTKKLYQDLANLEEQRLSFKADDFKRVADNEHNILGLRIASLQLYVKAQTEAIQTAANNDIAVNKKTGADAQLIREKAARDILLLNEDTEQQIKDLRLKSEQETNDALLQKRQDLQDKIFAMGDETLSKVKSNSANAGQEVQDNFGKVLQMASPMLNQFFQDFSSQQQARFTQEQTNVQALVNSKVITEQEGQKRLTQIRREAAKQEKAFALFQAFISQSQAILAVLGDKTIPTILKPVAIGIAVAEAAAQIALIAARPLPAFKSGKVKIDGPGSETSDSILARISRNESVINAEATKRYQPALEAINAMKFEDYLAGLHVPSHPNYSMPMVSDEMMASHISHPQQIDYDKLGEAIVKHQGRISDIPGIDINIDERGIHAIVKRENEITEFRNNRYSTN